jgi:heme exporter protein C
MTTAAAPADTRPRPVIDGVFWFAVACVVAAYVRAIVFTPVEATQGPSQKIFYIHISAVMAGYTAFAILGLMSCVHLWLKDERTDRVAAAAAEVAVLFFTVVLMAGSLWGKVIWGTWWVWELRITLTLLLWFLGVGYIVMRGAIEDAGMRARFSAALGVLQVLLIPFIHLSVYIVRDHMHPMPIMLKPDKPSMPAAMVWTWVAMSLAFIVFGIALIRARYRLGILQDAVVAADPGDQPW